MRIAILMFETIIWKLENRDNFEFIVIKTTLLTVIHSQYVQLVLGSHGN